jgi:hypothetical protein
MKYLGRSSDDNVKVKSGKLVEVKSRDRERDNSRQKVNDEEGEKNGS